MDAFHLCIITSCITSMVGIMAPLYFNSCADEANKVQILRLEVLNLRADQNLPCAPCHTFTGSIGCAECNFLDNICTRCAGKFHPVEMRNCTICLF